MGPDFIQALREMIATRKAQQGLPFGGQRIMAHREAMGNPVSPGFAEWLQSVVPAVQANLGRMGTAMPAQAAPMPMAPQTNPAMAKVPLQGPGSDAGMVRPPVNPFAGGIDLAQAMGGGGAPPALPTQAFQPTMMPQGFGMGGGEGLRRMFGWGQQPTL